MVLKRSSLLTAAVLTPLCLGLGHELVQARFLRHDNDFLRARIRVLSEIQAKAKREADAACAACEAASTPVPVSDERVETPEEPLADLLPGAFAFVRGERMVLSSDADLRWVHAELRGDAVGIDGPAWAERDTHLSNHEGYESLSESTFDLYGAKGRVCTARLGEAFVRAEVEGEIGLDWSQAEAEAYFQYAERRYEKGPSRGEDALIEALGRERILTQGPARLEVEFEAVEGDCSDALWARESSLSAPSLWRSAPVQREAELDRVRSSELHAQARADFESDRAQYPDDFRGLQWDAHIEETFELTRWEGEGGQSFTTANMGVAGVCGEMETRLELARGGGDYARGPGRLDAMFTLDGSRFILQSQAGDSYLRREAGGEYETVREAVTQFYGCPC